MSNVLTWTSVHIRVQYPHLQISVFSPQLRSHREWDCLVGPPAVTWVTWPGSGLRRGKSCVRWILIQSSFADWKNEALILQTNKDRSFCSVLFYVDLFWINMCYRQRSTNIAQTYSFLIAGWNGGKILSGASNRDKCVGLSWKLA